MLQITIPGGEMYDESTNQFIYTKQQTLQLEHSLVSISKWEAKWHKIFLSDDKKTKEQMLDYVKCMTITQCVNPSVYLFLTEENVAAIEEYINNPMTATYFSRPDKKKSSINREKVSSELIYYWMITFNIPYECQKWHLNRLLTLIEICQVKNEPPKKRTSREIAQSNAILNAARKKKLHTKG